MGWFRWHHQHGHEVDKPGVVMDRRPGNAAVTSRKVRRRLSSEWQQMNESINMHHKSCRQLAKPEVPMAFTVI